MTREGNTIAKEGYLLKESLHFKVLRKRWVVLSWKGYLDFYKDDALLVPTETLDLYTFYDVAVSYDKGSKPYQFEIYSNHAYQADRIFIASSTQDMNDWIKQIKHCMDEKNTKTITLQTYTEAVSRIDNLKNELNKIKYKHSKEMETKLKHLAKSKDKQVNELKSYIHKLEKEFFSLQNEMAQDIDSKAQPTHVQRGLLIFQQDCVTNKQLREITNYYQSNMEKAPIFVCGDNHSSANQSICYPITTYFYSRNEMPTLYAYKTLINKQFKELSQYLMNGHDIIIQLDTTNSSKYTTQIIYHKIGVETDGAKLPFSFIEYIQHKIDELTKFAYSTQIVKCYIYNKTQYKATAIKHKTDMKSYKSNKTKKSNLVKAKYSNKKRRTSSSKSKTTFSSNTIATTKAYKQQEDVSYFNSYSNGDDSKGEVKVDVDVDCYFNGGIIWQWRNNKNKWISYDDKTQNAIESLVINGIYEYATNSFIAKITKTSGVHVNVSNESKREIRRIKSYKAKPIVSNTMPSTPTSIAIASKPKRKAKIKHKTKGIAARFAHLNIDPTKMKVGATPPRRKRAKEETNFIDDSFILDKKTVSPTPMMSPMISPMMKYKERSIVSGMNETKSVIMWQWKTNNNRWHSYPTHISEQIEQLEMGHSYQYTLNQKTFKITKHSSNWAIQIDLKTLKKNNIRQTVKKININAFEI